MVVVVVDRVTGSAVADRREIRLSTDLLMTQHANAQFNHCGRFFDVGHSSEALVVLVGRGFGAVVVNRCRPLSSSNP